MGKGNRIAIIGHFGGNENILDGQTIKTKILYDELSNKTDWTITKVDTYLRKKNPVKLIFKTCFVLFTTKDVIVLLSGNGMKVYFPLLSLFARLFNTRVYHDVIGGNLDCYVDKFPKFKNYLNSFTVNWVETLNLKKKLQQRGVNNCEVLPNFKRLNITKIENIEYYEPFKFCMFSRVMKEKGIEIAIETVEEINKKHGKVLCQLDIFGRIDDGYIDRFDDVLRNSTSAICYKGTVSYDRSVEAIKDYYALLFPTYWSGEGFPGTIIDAFSAGLPVIATDWNCNGEIVINNYNGILYPNNDIGDLQEAIEWLISNVSRIQELKSGCIETAKRFQPDEYIKTIIFAIEK